MYVLRELREFDLSEAKARFIAFVPRANKKQYFLVKEDRQLKEDILKAILETDESEVSRTLKEAKLEGEAAGVLEATAKILKAYKDLLPENALQIRPKPAAFPSPLGKWESRNHMPKRMLEKMLKRALERKLV